MVMEDYIYKKIGSIVFGMLSADTIRKMTSVKIVTPELYDREGYPVDGGLMDTRLGVIDPGLKCKTCGEKMRDCIGHFGHIELARPIVHVKYIDTVLMFLRCVCKDCSKILVPQDKIDKQAKLLEQVKKYEGTTLAWRKQVKRFLEGIKNIKKCPHCKAKQKPIKIEKPSVFLEDNKRLSPIEVRARLEKISDLDVELLGLNSKYARPEWMILTLLPVPPVTIRPSITLESGERSEDDLTHKLGDIVRINQRLFENINAGAPEIIVEDLWDLLQYHVTTFFDNNIAQVPPARQRSGGQPLKTLTGRIGSKEGRFRHNLAGKRVNYAARTVISPDPKIEINEVGVPLLVAMDLTVPELVTEWNIERLKSFVENGPIIYPGANYVLRPDGKRKRITDETKQQLLEELQPGYIVERHLLDQDIVIFNRQPSLHRMNIMAHRVKVLSGRSFRVNPAVCLPYGADFDGDEMNLHVPQTEEARAEAEVLMEVHTQMITPKNGLNVIGCIADGITGNYLLTRGFQCPKERAMQILGSAGVKDTEKFHKFKNIVDGKEIFSAILPNDLNFVGRSKDGGKVIIRNGELIEGIIDKVSIGNEGGMLIRALCEKYGSKKGLELLGLIFRLGIEAISKIGFTVTIADTDLDPEVSAKCKEIISSSERKVTEYIEKYHSKELEVLPGMTAEDTLEVRILEVLNKARNRVGEIISEVSTTENPTIIMAVSGAQGKILNLAQMAACVGQQALRGKRIECGYRKRTLPIFTPGDLSPVAKGFIRRGFKEGLAPAEFFMHAITGRDSLMDVALRTPKSGYLYRRLSNTLQDLKVCYDETVRDANDNIIQFKYSEDGLDVSKTEGGSINVLRIVEEVKNKK